MNVRESAGLDVFLKTLKLPSFAAQYASSDLLAESEGWSFERYLKELCEQQVQDRDVRKVDRLRQRSHLPPDKTAQTLDLSCLSPKVRSVLPTLCEGKFVDEAENVLAFGLQGRGKAHCVCGRAQVIAHLVRGTDRLATRPRAGRSVHDCRCRPLSQTATVATSRFLPSQQQTRLRRFARR